MGNRIKLSLEDIAYINLFEKVTKANVKDCIFNPEKNKIIFIVEEGQAGMAIGKNGVNIKKLEKKLNKKIEVLEFSKDPLKFLVNIFRPVRISNAYISERSDGKKILYASIVKDKLGMVKAKMKSAKELLSKYYKFDEIIFQ